MRAPKTIPVARFGGCGAVTATMLWSIACGSGAAAPLPASSDERTAPTAATRESAARNEEELSRELRGLPTDVLVGTDVAPLSELLANAAVIAREGRYTCEQGGASAEVRISSEAVGATLTRAFAEPGMNPQTTRYVALERSANGVRLSGPDVEVVGTRRGILVLEKRSGVDGIPDSLWIEYERAAR